MSLELVKDKLKLITCNVDHRVSLGKTLLLVVTSEHLSL